MFRYIVIACLFIIFCYRSIQKEEEDIKFEPNYEISNITKFDGETSNSKELNYDPPNAAEPNNETLNTVEPNSETPNTVEIQSESLRKNPKRLSRSRYVLFIRI